MHCLIQEGRRITEIYEHRQTHQNDSYPPVAGRLPLRVRLLGQRSYQWGDQRCLHATIQRSDPTLRLLQRRNNQLLRYGSKLKKLKTNPGLEFRKIFRHEQKAGQRSARYLQEVLNQNGQGVRVPQSGRERGHRQGRDSRPDQSSEFSIGRTRTTLGTT